VTEYLFRNEDLLDEAIKTAIEDNTFRSDDLEFTFAARVSNRVLFHFWSFYMNSSVKTQLKLLFLGCLLLFGKISCSWPNPLTLPKTLPIHAGAVWT
jgi:hypothetical protein